MPPASEPTVPSLGHVARRMADHARLWRYCARRLNENNLLAMSAALSFRTIFALIPTLVLALLIAGALGFVEDSKRSVRAFLDASGFTRIIVSADDAPTGADPADDSSGRNSTATVPPAARRVINVADEIEAVIARVQSQLTLRRIGPVGAALFIWTALSLVATIETSLNRVFGAARSRSVPRRIVLYWSAITLGPAALAVANHLARQTVNLAQQLPYIKPLMLAIGWAGPVLVGVFVLAGVYTLLPNTRVRVNAALGGALAVVLAWLVAKWAFDLYVQRFVLRGNLYGILGALPLFMLWLNALWTIFLFGAELTHTAAHFAELARRPLDGPEFLAPAHALAAVLLVTRAFHAGRGPVPDQTLRDALGLSPALGDWLLARLAAAGLVCAVRDRAGPAYVPARPAEQVRVADVLAAADPLPPSAGAAEVAAAGSVAQAARQLYIGAGDVTLAELLAREANLSAGPQPSERDGSKVTA